MTKGKILCIDYGSRKCGMAISDDDKEIALSRGVVERSALSAILKNLITSECIDEIIVGLPLNLKGKDSFQTKEVRTFAQKIAVLFPHISIKLWDERLSSQAVASSIKNIMQKGAKKQDDAEAMYILQGYLDRA